MITIFFTRHSKSTRNLYDANGKPILNNVTDTSFRDTALCPDGIEKVIQKREILKEEMGVIDAILTSPLKRCVQTTLLTYQDVKDKSVYPIYVMSLLMEYCSGPDSTGVPMSQLCSDPDIFSYCHFPSLNFEYLLEGYQSKNFSKNELIDIGIEWCALDYRINTKRTKWFFEFIKKHFLDRRIHVISHGLFIYSILGQIIDNYETVKVIYNTETEKLKFYKIC
jgi:broad specificity phosphatase PhoE